MTQSPDAGARPDYENPPVVETVLGVQFDRLPGFRNAHLGAFWKTLPDDEWPLVLDAPVLQPQFERFSETAQWARSAPQLTLTQDPACRLQIKNRTGDRMIQVQNGRLHFNWLEGEGAPYPRYEEVRSGFIDILQRFLRFVDESGVGSVQPNQWEVTYVNHIPKGTVWNTPGDWGFFKPLAGVSSVGLPSAEGFVEAESFGGEWHFMIPERRGRLHVQWQHALRQSDRQASGEEIIRLTLTARGSFHNSADDIDAILKGVDLGRETIVCSFRELMSKTANEFWGLRDAADN